MGEIESMPSVLPRSLPGVDVEIGMHEPQLHDAATGKVEDAPTPPAQQAWRGGATMGDGAGIGELLKNEEVEEEDDEPGAGSEQDDVAQLRKELESAKEILSKLEEKLGPDPEE